MDEMNKNWEDELELAKDRFKKCQAWEEYARNNFRSDMKFAAGDAINNYQWPETIFAFRTGESRPCLTTNKIHTYNLNIKNKLLQNKTDTKFRAVSDSTEEAAKIYEGIYRHINYDSNGDSAIDTAAYNAIWGGIGWWRIDTDYEDAHSMDQKIVIRRIADALSVYIDPYCKEFDKSDAKFGFVYDKIPKKEWNRRYPEYKDISQITALGNEEDTLWETQDTITVAEYYTKTIKKQKLYALKDGTTITDEELKKKDSSYAKIKSKVLNWRYITEDSIDWYLIAGTQIVDHRPWVGKYIPLVCVIGEENVIDGQMDRLGNTRAMLSPQQIYNTWISSGAEYLLTQTKVQYIVSIDSIEEYQNTWKNSHLENPFVLPIKHRTEDGQEIPPPIPVQPPQYPQGYETGLNIADKDMMAASGIYEAQLGAPSNERTGKAIDARTSNGETSTYHYNDHLTKALIYSGKIILDLIPKVYDTERVIKILSLDGKTIHSVQIDPTAPTAHMPIDPSPGTAVNTNTIRAILNPNIGTYAVISDVGPDYQTKRLEDLNNLGQLLQQIPAIAQIAAGPYVREMDFDLAPEIADRLDRMAPPAALGLGPTPQEQQMNQVMTQQHQIIQKQEMEIMELKMKALEQLIQKDIDYKNAITNEEKANTERMKVVGAIDPLALKPVLREMISQILQHPVNSIIEAHALEEAQMIAKTQALINPPQQNQQQGGQNAANQE